MVTIFRLGTLHFMQLYKYWQNGNNTLKQEIFCSFVRSGVILVVVSSQKFNLYHHEDEAIFEMSGSTPM
jgi:hypothetical protein